MTAFSHHFIYFQVLKMEEISTILNSSLLRMRETSTISTFVAVRNTSVVAGKVASNAYEWRFILPPYILIFMLSIAGNFLVIATLTSNRRMRTITNVYLLNLVSFMPDKRYIMKHVTRCKKQSTVCKDRR